MGKVKGLGKVPVTMRAVVQRINRKLAQEGDEVLKIPRSARLRQEVGDFYLLDVNRNWITAKDVDLEAYGRELGVLQPWEEVRDEEEE